MRDADQGKSSQLPSFGTVIRYAGGKRKKKKRGPDPEQAARIHALQAENMARRSLMSPQGPRGDINPWNKS